MHLFDVVHDGDQGRAVDPVVAVSAIVSVAHAAVAVGVLGPADPVQATSSVWAVCKVRIADRALFPDDESGREPDPNVSDRDGTPIAVVPIFEGQRATVGLSCPPAHLVKSAMFAFCKVSEFGEPVALGAELKSLTGVCLGLYWVAREPASCLLEFQLGPSALRLDSAAVTFACPFGGVAGIAVFRWAGWVTRPVPVRQGRRRPRYCPVRGRGASPRALLRRTHRSALFCAGSRRECRLRE